MDAAARAKEGIRRGGWRDGFSFRRTMRARVSTGTGLFTEDATTTPYWLGELPAAPPTDPQPPATADAVVIGAGYTGLHAALAIARGGRSVVVLDAAGPGAGCSTRNGGQISTSIKPSLAALTKRHGAERARAIRAVGPRALDWIERFVAEEGIDCDFRRAGRFHAAHTRAHYEEAVREAAWRSAEEGVPTRAVPRDQQLGEIGSEFYWGGVVYERYATIHPARYHRGLLEAALAAGVHVAAPCRAEAIVPRDGGFEVTTPMGRVRARDVAVATNGYTEGVTPWLRRRVIPIGSYVIATEPLAPALVERLFPTRRIVSDTRKVVYYYTPSPDGRRVVFGGRVSSGETDPLVSGPRLHREMVRIFPELASARISHSWSGQVAYTFDELAHCGRREGIHYAMGYCGSGVSLSSYLGHAMGLRILGRTEGRTALDDLPFPTRPLYTGRPWFLPAAVAYYRWRDERDCARAAKSAARRTA